MTNGTKPTRTAFSTPMEAESQSAPKATIKILAAYWLMKEAKTRLPAQPLSASKPLMAAAIGKETK